MSARTPSIFDLAARCAWLDEIYRNGLTKCTGRWISGSGGHRSHGPCSNTATYADWADQYAYCDDHLEQADREAGSPFLAPWAGLVRALARAEADIEEIRGPAGPLQA